METKYQRVLLKLSGEYLGGAKGQGFDFDIVKMLTDQVCELHDFGIEIGIVLGGGNFFRGAGSIPLKIDRVSGDHIGMMATSMNSVMIKESLKSAGKKVSVMTGMEIPGIGKKFNKEKASKKMSGGTIMIFSGGTGNPYFSTDTAAVLRGLEIEADIVIKGTKVDGVYDKDPMKDESAVKYEMLSYSEVLEKDLKVMDGAAIALCRENNLPIGVLNIGNPRDLAAFVKGEKIGTIVHN